MSVVAIVQARTGSTRLPRKVLLDIAGRPMLGRVLDRLRACAALDAICVATSTDTTDDPVAALAADEGVAVHRGPLDDVLTRYVGAAAAMHASHVVRVTGDSPLVDPEYMRMAVDLHLSSRADLTCAKDPAQVIVGTGCEVITRNALEVADREGRDPHHREHVTWYVLEHRRRFAVRFLAVPQGLENPGIRLTVDELDDLEVVRAIYEHLGPRPFGVREVLELHRREGALFDRNRHVRQQPSMYAQHS
jgi:spore coat polysaccharide biosynthesis protein SpsF (cytidylyltransferase family)